MTEFSRKPQLCRSYSVGSVAILDNDTDLLPPNAFRKKCNILDSSSVDLCSTPKLPLVSFNHVAREVLSLSKSKSFYCDVLGFSVIPRPMFDCEGFWLWGYGLSLHLVETADKLARQEVLKKRLIHFSEALPRVDHM